MKILSPSETCTAANKNLPDFHQATWVWIIAICDCVVLPEVLSSVPSPFIYVRTYFFLQNILIFVFAEYMSINHKPCCTTAEITKKGKICEP